MENGTVSIRARDSKGELVTQHLAQAAENLRRLRASRTLENNLAVVTSASWLGSWWGLISRIGGVSGYLLAMCSG